MNNPMIMIYEKANNYISWLDDLIQTINFGDLIDRMTIVELKRERIDSAHYAEEHDIYIAAVLAIIRQFPIDIETKIKKSIKQIKELNGNIWDLEEDIRMNREAVCADLEEVGRRTLQIRDINDERVKIRNKINSLIGSHFEELKSCTKNFT